MRKVISLILMLTVCVVFAGAYSGGSGSSADPYQIADLDDLQELSDSSSVWDSCFIQMANINASATRNWDSDKGFSPIGNLTTRFTGKYNGGNFIIDSLFIDRSGENDIAFIGRTNGAIIDSLGLTNIDFSGDSRVGGFVGYNDNVSKIRNCYATGKIIADRMVGGLVGENIGSSEIRNSYSNVQIDGTSSIGGVVGYNYTGTVIENTYSIGSASGSGDNIGGLIGYEYGSTVTNSFWNSDSNISSAKGTGKITAELKNYITFTDEDSKGLNSAWDFVGNINDDLGNDDIWGISKNNNGYPILTSFADGDSLLSLVRLDSLTNMTTASVVGNGNILHLGSINPTAHGFCWSTLSNPTTLDNYSDENSASSSGFFTSNITGLIEGTTYFARAYTTNDFGTFYSNEIEFVAGVSVVVSDSISNISDNSAIGYGNIISLGATNPTAYGYCWNTSGDPIISDNYTDEGSTSSTGIFTTDITGLISGQQYYARAYATNSSGTSYGSEIEFIAYSSPAGSGTTIDPYKVASLGNIYWITQNSDKWDKNYIQTADINMERTMSWDNGKGFIPIGNTDILFSGVFNGAGFILNSLFINRPNSDYVGLFGKTDGSQIDSVSIRNADITGKYYVGSLVGYNYNTNVTKSYSNGQINGHTNVGGLVGTNWLASIENSYSLCSVNGSGSVGGLVGFNYSSTVAKCYSGGSASGSGTIGGLIGDEISSTITNSFWNSDSNASSSGGTGKTTLEMIDIDSTNNCFYKNGWDFVELSTNGSEDIWNQGNNRNDGYPYFDRQYPSDNLGLSYYSTEIPEGAGTESNPYQIANLRNLFWLSQFPNEWDKYYIQTADINAGASSTWDSNSGFTAIGIESTRFTGEYNGKGHIIDSLYINRPGINSIGLFGKTTNSEIDSLGLTNVNITGRGGVGALVGYNILSTVSNSYSTGNITGTNVNVGGLVGTNYSSIVTNTYSTATVNADEKVGGLVGINYGSASTVSNSYSTGNVSGNSVVGGFIGWNYMGTVINSFWNTETSGQSTSDGGIGKTTAEMTDTTTANCFFQNSWDFVEKTDNGTDDIWNQGNSRNNNYPYLAWQYPNDELGLIRGIIQPENGDGTESNPYQITDVDDLYWLSKTDSVWNKNFHFIQTADINLGESRIWNDSTGFRPIGNIADCKFIGEYHGQGHIIDSLFINRPSNHYNGLFGYTDGSLIDSLGVTNVNITGDWRAGGLVGVNYRHSIVNNCFSTGIVNGASVIGGLVGHNYYDSSEVNNCYSSVIVNGEDEVGGLVGYCYIGKITNSYSIGSSSGGGLVGRRDSSPFITNCFWDSTASGNSTSVAGTGKTTAEMKNYNTFTDTTYSAGLDTSWDFVTNPNDDSNNNDYWDMDQDGSGYPILSWQPETDTILTNNTLPLITGLQDTISFKNDTTSTLNIWDIVSDTQTEDSLLNYTFTTSNDSITTYYNSNSGILTLSSDILYFGFSELTVEVADNFGMTKDSVIVNVINSNELPIISGLQDTISFKNDTTSILNIWGIVSDTQTADSLLNYTFTTSNDSITTSYNSNSGILTLSSDILYFGISQFTIEVADNFGMTRDSAIVKVIRSQVGVIDNTIPKEFSLNQNYPNPFNPSTTIEFAIPKMTDVNITIYNILGQRIKTINMREKQAGIYKIIWNGENEFGQVVSTGIYFYKIIAGKNSDIKKMVFMK
ncbi:MAG: GLUG motif-containing protein [Candidatus Marinimicrobia bacterium]|nr:GLUG motif-containing protein [Candidatus Neomarinimicrobiota bacterium]